MSLIPFNTPAFVGSEHGHISEAIDGLHLSSDGPFTAKCRRWLIDDLGAAEVLLVSSCTAALEISALLLDLAPGDEVIMPSYTFVSTANAFALRGAVPVFVDIDPETLAIDADAARAAVTSRTRAIVMVHYAGVAGDVDAISALCGEIGVPLIEDAAQGMCADVGGRRLGAIGDIGCISFHETKNVTCGEGGALVLTDEKWIDAAHTARDKGTNRRAYMLGQVDKYTWSTLGSSYGLSEIGAAYLWGQLQEAESLTRGRLAAWERYHAAFEDIERAGLVRRPHIPAGRTHNAHMYYLLLPSRDQRDAFISGMRERSVTTVFHYIPLHSSPAGQRYARSHGSLAVTDDIAGRLVRLPMWSTITPADQDRVVAAARECLSSTAVSVT